MQRTFLRDILDFSAMAMQSLERDNFTTCFEPISPLEMDNSGVFYIFSIVIRYCLLFPIRLTILLVCTLIFIPVYFTFYFTKQRTEMIFRFYCQAFLWSFGARIHHHGTKLRMNTPHIYVANHTSFVDFMILSSHKFCHACVSEDHGGLFGLLFNVILKQNGSISFKRSEKQDRDIVNQKMRNHVADVKNAPMLIFPEGTCVNNKYTVLFQKGAFELPCKVIPVAIKFRRNLMDPYWNRRKHNFTEHLFYLMTRWKLEADVWWMECFENDGSMSATEFAMKVKDKISERGGLKSVLWNGYFKSSPVLRDREIMREAFREVYRKRESYRKEKGAKHQGEHRFRRRAGGNSSLSLKENLNLLGSPHSTVSEGCGGIEFKNTKDEKQRILIDNAKNSVDRKSTKDENEKKGSAFKKRVPIKFYKREHSKPNHSVRQNTADIMRLNVEKEKTFFGDIFTYNGFMDHVLVEYLNFKKNANFEVNISDGMWWGYNKALRINKPECGCGSKSGRTFYCHRGNCRSEMFRFE